MWFGAALCCLAALPAQADGVPLQRFGDWLVGCDNRARCTALGIPPEAENSGTTRRRGVILRITADASTRTAPEVELLPFGDGSPPIMLGVADSPGIPLQGSRRPLEARQAETWLAALRGGIGIEARGVPAGTFSLPSAQGFTAAWAVLTRPHAPAANTAPPRRVPARETIISGHPPRQITGFQCPAGGTHGQWRRFSWDGGAELWSIACTGAGEPTLHWLHSRPGAAPSPLRLPDAGRPSIDAGAAGLTDAEFLFDFGILRARAGPPGREDCGIERGWGFNGSAWSLLVRLEMPACVGLERADWIATHSTR